MNKRYRLLKDLPDSKPGDVYINDGKSSAYYKDGNVNGSYWLSGNVENNPDWFQPIEAEKPKRIEITNVGQHNHCTTLSVYQFTASEKISKDKYPSIKEAIECTLNGGEIIRQQVFQIDETQDFIDVIRALKESAVKSQKFDIAVQWRQVERLLMAIDPRITTKEFQTTK